MRVRVWCHGLCLSSNNRNLRLDSRYGESALHLATRRNQILVVDALLRAGCNAQLKTKRMQTSKVNREVTDGRTALDIARRMVAQKKVAVAVL